MLSVVDPVSVSIPPGKRAGAVDAFKPNKATASSSIHTATSWNCPLHDGHGLFFTSMQHT